MASVSSDICRAWRGLRGRRLAGLAHVLLVAIAVGGAAVAFSAADAFVFNRAPYPHANRLVIFQRATPVGTADYLSDEEYRALAARTDLFTGMFAHGGGAPVYVSVDGSTRSVRVQDVEPGLFDALGVAPRWGRGFLPGEERAGPESAVLVGEDLARARFGDPIAALGQSIDGPAGLLRIVGVMSGDFRFPTALEGIWRVTDAIRPAPRRSAAIVAVVAHGVPVTAVQGAVDALVGANPNPGAVPGLISVVPLSRAQRDPRAYTNYGAYTGVDAPRLFSTLLAAAICLALIVCFNVAGLELASALQRSGVYRILTTLGATRGTLMRQAILESAILTGAGALAGVGLAVWGTFALAAALPVALDSVLANPIDLDLRAAMFLAGLALVAALLIALPVVWYVTRPGVANGLRRDAARQTPSRTQSSLRFLLMTGQVALCVFLLAGAVLFVRTYAARVGEDKGFDSTNLATIEIVPRRGSARPAQDLEQEAVARLRGHPAVRAASRAGLPPFVRGAGTSHLWIDGRTSPAAQVAFRSFPVDPDTFETMGLRVLSGRGVQASDTADQIVVDDGFARRYFPNGDAVGARFSLGREQAPGRTSYEIVGVASRVRLDQSDAPMGGAFHVMHRRIDPDAAPLTFVARLVSPQALGDVTAAVRAIAGDAVVRTGMMDDRYAEIYGGARIAAGLTGGFGIMALCVAMVGLYGVTAFLVAGRTREIGIRVALGAERRHVRRLVIGPAMQSVLIGTVAGTTAAVFASRLVRSQLFGVTTADPSTYAGVVVLMVLTALLATWIPLGRAARVDPAIALRAE